MVQQHRRGDNPEVDLQPTRRFHPFGSFFHVVLAVVEASEDTPSKISRGYFAVKYGRFAWKATAIASRSKGFPALVGVRPPGSIRDSPAKMTALFIGLNPVRRIPFRHLIEGRRGGSEYLLPGNRVRDFRSPS